MLLKHWRQTHRVPIPSELIELAFFKSVSEHVSSVSEALILVLEFLSAAKLHVHSSVLWTEIETDRLHAWPVTDLFAVAQTA
jgi:hypothetical protein